MSEPSRTHSRRARSRAAGSACALALVTAAVAVSTSFAQGTPTPPDPPQPPATPAPPATPDTPGTPGDEPPPGGQNPSSPPPPEARASKLDPFPVVVVAGRQGKRATEVTELSVRGPRKARVVVRCLGERCPMRRVARTIPRAKRLRVTKAERVYSAGVTIEVRVSSGDRVGKYTKIRFRRGRTPARSDACLQPGSSRPSACS